MIAINKEQPLPESEQLRKSLLSASLVNTYWRACAYDKLYEHYQNVLALQSHHLGTDYSGLAYAYENLGVVSLLRGDNAKAVEFHRKALAIRLAIGESDYPVAQAYNQLGNAYSDNGEEDKGLECHELALKIYQNLKLETKIANSYNNLGETLRRKGDFAKARQYLELGLEEALELFGTDDFQTAISYGNLGKLQVQEGEIEEALSNLNKTKRIFLRELGSKHPHTKKTQRWINRAKQRQAKATGPKEAQ